MKDYAKTKDSVKILILKIILNLPSLIKIKTKYYIWTKDFVKAKDSEGTNNSRQQKNP